jgi:hypothetical protein
MDMTSYEETRVPRDEDWAKYLKEGMDVGVLLWNGKVGCPHSQLPSRAVVGRRAKLC